MRTATFQTKLLARTISRSVAVPYLYYAPPQPGINAALSTVVYLHGAGAKGSDLAMVERESLPRLIAQGLPFPHCLVCPQCPPEVPGWNVDDLNHLFDSLVFRHQAEPDRIVLTGISMGGRGVWEFAYWHRDKLAGVVPLCGFGIPNLAPRLVSLPVWMFHGENDSVLPVARSDEMAQALRNANATDMRYDRLPGLGHNIGETVYARPELWEWVGQCRRTVL